MSCDSRDSKSIVEIFNGLHFEKENLADPITEDILKQFNLNPSKWNINSKLMDSVKTCEETVAEASKAQELWANFSPLERVNILHKVWGRLQNASKEFPEIKSFPTFAEYFNFYSDYSLQSDHKIWEPSGVISIFLSSWSSFFAAATVPAALVAGCSLIIFAPETELKFLLLLEDIFLRSGLPENLFKVSLEFDSSLVCKTDKVFFCGSYTSAQKLYESISVTSFNFFCPNNTGALILESADLHSATNKVISETWGGNSSFAVSNVVVQESISEKFIDTLKSKLEQFMSENTNSRIFDDEIIAEKIAAIVSKATKAGASVINCVKLSYRKWSPTVVVNYQSQDIDEEAPVLKVLLCRTAKEGVALLNNCRYTLGASVWSEIPSQALEISSSLLTPNVWINCHGTLDPTVPVQLSDFSGNCVLGGTYGIFEFVTPKLNNSVIESDSKKEVAECETAIYDYHNRKKIIFDFSHESYKTWRRNRHHHLLNIANFFRDDNSLKYFIDDYIKSRSSVSFFERNWNDEFLTVKEKIPTGVILLLITTEISKESFVRLIMAAIAAGNALVVTLNKKNPEIESTAENIGKNLPKNFLQILIGIKLGLSLASDAKVKAIWLYPNSKITSEMFGNVKNCNKKYLRQIFTFPENCSVNLPETKCFMEKVLWLPKIDHFP